MKYKVGDKVRVRKDIEIGNVYYMEDRKTKDSFVSDMAEYRGRVVTIARCDEKYRIEGSGYNWTDEMFEGLENQKIVITTDGKETLARLYDGKNVIKTATARCAPDDTFDFATGAKLAFDRLMGVAETTDKKPMTCREKLAIEHPNYLGPFGGGCKGCPHDYGYAKRECNNKCRACWDRPVEQPVEEPAPEKPAEKEEPRFKVGDRVRFASYSVLRFNVGDVGTIVEYDGNASPYKVKRESDGYEVWTSECNLEKVEFVVGDLVKVTKTGKTYSRYESWIEKHAAEYVDKFTFGKAPANGDVGVIRAIAPHGDGCEENICLIECAQKRVFVIGLTGIEKTEFTPHLICGKCHHGNIGEPTNYKDAIGRPLCIGDVVEHFSGDCESYGETVIVKCKLSYRGNTEKVFVMGIEDRCDDKNGTTGEWKILKKRSFDEVANGEEVFDIKYVKEME